MRRRPGVLLILFAVLIVTGCAGTAGYPNRSVNSSAELQALAVYTTSDILKIYNSPNDSDRGGKTRQAYRDEVVNGRLAAMDIQYNLYQQRLYEQGTEASILTDWVVLGMGGASAVMGGAAAKAALGAAITGVTGAKVSFDKNAYFAKTLPALVASMQATRKEVLLRIRKGLELGDDKYPLTQALVDLEDYYNAGTIPGAITGITASADEASRKASEELKVVLETTRGPEFLKNKPRVDAIVRKIKALSDGQAIILNQTPPTRDAKSETTLKEMDERRERFVNGKAARQALVVRARTDDRTEENLSEWEKALGVK